ncbi:Uncharacterized conserved protein, DUF1800 family [Singulisphaera sp. GP187]|uniref:DUF1800 domain-containing protein n=1 Tax=Singulisphaera sp. GP187 TaxID=1882752 RepID=UPI00092637EE|nr:DUF1800 domain-containing protein [Singulisphaera sp. GP187]SIO18415.1 Uncharacterized conserved protein, DUF1800 family [Singulisphaera sp. GP187]
MNSPPLLTDPARAWAPWDPDSKDRWDLARVGHLHRRAGFAPSWSVLQRDLSDGPDASVDRLIEGEPTAGDGQPAPAFDAMLDAMSGQLAEGASLARLQGIWLYRMVFTPHPLRERMTLFWHNHFATSHGKVKNSLLMQRQNDLLRSHALGDFKTLLSAIGKDPAMLIWLDSTENRKARPNENYAREVMELFTLGRGHYTEKDVQEAARAFTGWFVVRDRFQVIQGEHDLGTKQVLGRAGLLQGDDIAPILLDQAACAEFLCEKLIRQFVTEVDPIPAALIASLAEPFRASGYDIRVPLKTILRSNLFHTTAVRRRRVKSPVEFTIGTIRALEVLKPTVQADALAQACGQMGQNLYAPPSVAGWDGGASWANSTTMLARANFALALLSDQDAALGKRLNPQELAALHGATTSREACDFLIDLLVQDAFDRKLRERVSAKVAPKEIAATILTSPEYQLA